MPDRRPAFDPALACGGRDGAASPAPADPLSDATRILYGAYAFLRDNDLAAVSATSARLRSVEDGVRLRVAEELEELAGAIDGSHRHADHEAGVLLEGTQVVYWVVLSALRARIRWDELRPDRALATHDEHLDIATAVRLLRAEARRWDRNAGAGAEHSARCHATLALVGQACHAAGVPPRELVAADLAALRGKAYLEPYFAAQSMSGRNSAPSS